MFNYDISELENFSFSSIRDVFALIAQSYNIKSKYDIDTFKYESDYLNRDKSYKILPRSWIEKCYAQYAESDKNKANYIIKGAGYDILSERYNQLLRDKKKFIENENYKKTLMDEEMKNGEIGKIVDVNYTNSYFPYSTIPIIADYSMYKRLRTDPYAMPIPMIMLIIEASGFPLRMTLEFEKGSIMHEKYTPIFNAIPSVYEQLVYYFSIECITVKTYITEVLNMRKRTYTNFIHGSINYEEFEKIANSIGAKLKISFTHQIIKTYDSYKKKTDKLMKNIQKLIYDDDDKSIIESKIKNSILKDIPELEITETLIKLEKMRQSSNLNNITQKKEADSK